MPQLKYLANVATLKLNTDVCIGCGLCVEVCPHAVFTVEEGKARIADRDRCMECGACERNCPVNALSVHAGVGCAKGILAGAMAGTEPTCDCGEGKKRCC